MHMIRVRRGNVGGAEAGNAAAHFFPYLFFGFIYLIFAVLSIFKQFFFRFARKMSLEEPPEKIRKIDTMR